MTDFDEERMRSVAKRLRDIRIGDAKRLAPGSNVGLLELADALDDVAGKSEALRAEREGE